MSYLYLFALCQPSTMSKYESFFQGYRTPYEMQTGSNAMTEVVIYTVVHVFLISSKSLSLSYHCFNEFYYIANDIDRPVE